MKRRAGLGSVGTIFTATTESLEHTRTAQPSADPIYKWKEAADKELTGFARSGPRATEVRNAW
jgi:hypothetical protein